MTISTSTAVVRCALISRRSDGTPSLLCEYARNLVGRVFTSRSATRRSNWLPTSTTAAALAGDAARAANRLRHHEWLTVVRLDVALCEHGAGQKVIFRTTRKSGSQDYKRDRDQRAHNASSSTPHRVGPWTRFMQSKRSRRRLVRQRDPFWRLLPHIFASETN